MAVCARDPFVSVMPEVCCFRQFFLNNILFHLKANFSPLVWTDEKMRLYIFKLTLMTLTWFLICPIVANTYRNVFYLYAGLVESVLQESVFGPATGRLAGWLCTSVANNIRIFRTRYASRTVTVSEIVFSCDLDKVKKIEISFTKVQFRWTIFPGTSKCSLVWHNVIVKLNPYPHSILFLPLLCPWTWRNPDSSPNTNPDPVHKHSCPRFFLKKDIYAHVSASWISWLYHLQLNYS